MMKFTSTLILFPLILVSGVVQAREKPAPDQVAQAMQRVADWQIAHFRDNYSHNDQPHAIGQQQLVATARASTSPSAPAAARSRPAR